MLTAIAGVVAFTALVLALVGVLLAARSRLVPAGDVHVVINDDADRKVAAAAGTTLLGALSDAAILVPSACGGQGTCGACKVKVTDGGGELLPTETSHVKRGEARDGVRLACQVKLRNDMAVELPEDVFGTKSWTCRVLRNDNVATFIKELELELPEHEAVDFRAGGYIQLHVPPHEVAYRDFDIPERFRDDWDHFELWRYRSTVAEPVQRAYSMANFPGEQGIIKLNIRVASPPPEAPDAPPGQASSWVFSLKPGDEVTISGPYGEFAAQDTDAEMVIIGGGAGMAPLRSIVFDQLLRVCTSRKISYWYGARSLREAFYVDQFDDLAARNDNFEWHLALSSPLPEDAWEGETGFIHQVVYDRYLADHPAPEEIEYYLCGPPPMIAACRAMLHDLGVDEENIFYDEF